MTEKCWTKRNMWKQENESIDHLKSGRPIRTTIEYKGTMK